MKNNNANKKQNKKIDSKLLIIIGIIIAIVGIVISYIIINHNKSSEPVDEDRNGNLVVRKGYEKLDTKHKINIINNPYQIFLFQKSLLFFYNP